MRVVTLLLLLCVQTAAHAITPVDQNSPADATQPLPPPPLEPLPEGLEPTDAGLEPEIIIVPKEDVTFVEYRIGGRLYMIKVVPAQGPPYYLIDPEGNGEFSRSDLEPEITPSLWVLKRF
ncbi:MAG: DUF2782 domain-containing protein [Gammaproteobacteria bacterium]|nr:DUF2782 domain-containing protein [Gammaproteobacteria bacterium]